MSIDRRIDAKRSNLKGTPIQKPHESRNPDVEPVTRVQGTYRMQSESSSAEQIAHERQGRSRSLRNASIGLAGLLGATATADYANMIDPNPLFYAVNVASVLLTDIQARAEARWSEIFQGLHEVEQGSQRIKEDLQDLEEKVRATGRYLDRMKTAFDGVRIHSYDAPQQDEHKEYLPS